MINFFKALISDLISLILYKVFYWFHNSKHLLRKFKGKQQKSKKDKGRNENYTVWSYLRDRDLHVTNIHACINYSATCWVENVE